MKVGASYYPELSDPKIWRRDLTTAREIGLKALRCGEFAWDYLEPADGEFNFDWALQFLDLAHELGYDVIWCTPSATPPPRFFYQYENLGAINFKGEPMPVGVRRNYTPGHPEYLQRCAQIAQKLAENLAGHSAIKGWQIDNEIAGDGFACRGGYWTLNNFRNYLRERFETLENLNCLLGGGVWGENYHDWSEIPIPDPVISSESFPPGLRLEFQRYNSEIWRKFYSVQYHALKTGGATQPVTTNFFNFTWDIPFDLHQWKNELDSVGISNYLEEENESALQFALMRSVAGAKRPFWVLEQKAGQQRGQNMYSDNLVERLTEHLKLCRNSGAEYAIYWHLRQHTHGCELEHGAVLNHDGRKGRVAKAIELAIKAVENESVIPVLNDIGLVFDIQQHWAQKLRPAHLKWDYRLVLQEEYFPAMRRAFGEVALPGSGDIAGHGWRVLVLPHYQLDLGITDLLLDLANRGTTIILTADYARLDQFNAVLPQPLLAALRPALSIPDLELIQLDEGADFQTSDGTTANRTFAWPFGEIDITSGTAPASLEFPHGKGKIIILAADFAPDYLEQFFNQLQP